MACVLPQELDDRELLAYLDGEAGHQVVAHLEQCPHCRERAEQLAQLQGRMTAELYRIMCPSTMELGEYHLGLLPGDQSATVTRHLTECPHCSGEVAQLKGYLGELAPELEFSLMERVREQARVLIAHLVGESAGTRPSGLPLPAPAFVGTRGQEEGPYLYEAEDVQIAIEIQEDAERPDRKALLGLVIGADPGGMTAQLWQAEQMRATVTVDSLGNFAIAQLEPGEYQLILSSPQMEIHIQPVRIGWSGSDVLPG
jgi:hypothetical protein